MERLAPHLPLMVARIRVELHLYPTVAHLLDDIAGVGKKRKVALLKEFGTLDNIKNASIEDLAKIKGMNQKTAENVYNFYH